eukprot:scaffold1359_cov158-Alexandrium_tamarense.AAC.2
MDLSRLYRFVTATVYPWNGSMTAAELAMHLRQATTLSRAIIYGDTTECTQYFLVFLSSYNPPVLITAYPLFQYTITRLGRFAPGRL